MDVETYMKPIKEGPSFYTNNERKRRGIPMRRKGITRGSKILCTKKG